MVISESRIASRKSSNRHQASSCRAVAVPAPMCDVNSAILVSVVLHLPCFPKCGLDAPCYVLHLYLLCCSLPWLAALRTSFLFHFSCSFTKYLGLDFTRPTRSAIILREFVYSYAHEERTSEVANTMWPFLRFIWWSVTWEAGRLRLLSNNQA